MKNKELFGKIELDTSTKSRKTKQLRIKSRTILKIGEEKRALSFAC